MTLRYRALLYTKGVLRQVYQLEPFHLCKLYLAAMCRAALSDLLRSPSAQEVRPRTVALVDAAPASSPVV
jgi:hypothetical protein